MFEEKKIRKKKTKSTIILHFMWPHAQILVNPELKIGFSKAKVFLFEFGQIKIEEKILCP